MALARVARSGLRRSRGTIGSYSSEKDMIFCERISDLKSFIPSLEKINVHSNLTYLSTIKKANHMGFWSREMRTTPHYRYPSAEGLVESGSEYDEPRYPGLEATKKGEKPRVVVLGTGWAACRFLKGLDTKIYDVVCISPRNHMVFTPLLASTCVGTLEFRSVVEPVSRIQSALATSPSSYFYLASCISIDTDKHEVYCETMSNDGLPNEPYQFKVAYDKLVIAAGAEPLTFGIKGVKENAYFLREVNHAQEIRKKLLLSLMLSENPGISEEEKKRLLHCVIIGGGPTGVEFSGELSDFIRRDVQERHSHVKDYIKVTLIEANEILSSFDVGLRQYATNHLTKSGVHLMRGVVKEVHPKKIVLSDGTHVPYGLLVWSTGVGPSQFVKSLNLPKSPGGRIGVDEWLRVPSVEDVFALGDCAGFLEQAGKSVLPALAQVAERQGKYLVEVFNRVGKQDGGKAFSAKDVSLGEPFVYKHLGNMASVGRYKALVDLRQSKDAKGISLAGFVSWLIWRSAYLTRVVSWRNRFYVAVNPQAQLALAAEDRRKPDPPPLIFPRSVSPYVSRRKSDDTSATWIHHPLFYSTPQVGPSYSTSTTTYFEATRSFKTKNRFSLFSILFRSRSEKFNSDPRVHYHPDSCDEPSSSSSSPSWFSAIFAVRRKKKQSSRTPRVEEFDQFGPCDRRSCRIIDRGMSPAIEADSGDECDQQPSGSSLEVSPRWKRTPTVARRSRAGTRSLSGLAFCLSPLVRASPNRHWNQKGGLPPDIPFTGEARPSMMNPHLATAAGFCANRSRKLADFGRVNHNR